MKEQRLFVLRRCKTHERSLTTLLRSCPPAARVCSRPTESRPLLAAPSVGPVRGPVFRASFQCADFEEHQKVHFDLSCVLGHGGMAHVSPENGVYPDPFCTVPGQLQAGHAHELFAVCESSGCLGLEWSRLNSTGQYLCQDPFNSLTSRIADDGGSADLSRVFALRSG